MTLAARPLSVREMEVVRLVVEGRSNRQISDDLLVTSDTVKTHLRNIFRKCEVRNRAELVAWWFERFNRTAERVGATGKGYPSESRYSRRPAISRLSLPVLIVSLAFVPLFADPGVAVRAFPGAIVSSRASGVPWSSGSVIPGDRVRAVC